MFASSQRFTHRFAFGAVVVSGVALAGSAASASAPVSLAVPNEDDAGPASNCIVRAVSAADHEAGVEPPVRCFGTFPEAMASLGVTLSPGTTPSTLDGSTADELPATFRAQSLGGPNLLAIHYQDPRGPVGWGQSLIVFGDSCGDWVYSVGPVYADSLSATMHGICSKVKHYREPNFRGAGWLTDGGMGAVRSYPWDFDNHVRSLKYGR